MKILVTGAEGFLGRNLVHMLYQSGYTDIFKYGRKNEKIELDEFCSECEAVFHIAGVNRPQSDDEFVVGNVEFTKELLDCLRKHNNKAPVIVSSSVQAMRDNHYGRSKKAMEAMVFDYGKEAGVKTYIYRLPNLFGKWSRPNYNSVVATFCHNIANDIEITISDPKTEIELAYIDDVCIEFIKILKNEKTQSDDFLKINTTHKVTLGEIAKLLYSFKDGRNDLQIPDMSKAFTKKLYATYLSYVPDEKSAYPLKMNVDSRGSFTEFIRTPDRGQVSINISKPGIVKGNHWHHTKNEKFLVVAGQGIIRLRCIDSETILEYNVDGENLQVVDIPPGYTHNIENTGKSDLVTVMWVSESFDPSVPDTYPMEV